MTLYTPLEAALRFIPRPLYNYATEHDFLSWMLDAYREARLREQLQSNVRIFEIHENKIVLPDDIKEINLVTYLYKQPSSDDIASFCSCCTETTTTIEDTNSICEYSIAYKLFLDSPYYNNNYAPLRYVGNSSSILCKSCPNRDTACQQTFTISPDRVLHTSLCEGYLCIDYDTEAKDENGNILIPDITALKQYLSYYAQAKLWEERAAGKEGGAGNEADKALIKAEIYLRKVKGMINLGATSANSVSNIQWDGYQKLIKLPELYVYSRQNYGYPS